MGEYFERDTTGTTCSLSHHTIAVATLQVSRFELYLLGRDKTKRIKLDSK